MKTNGISEDELIARLQARDQQVFSVLYDNYSGALFGVLFKMLQNEALAEDALQVAFVRIWKNIARYDQSKGRLFTWMITVTRNIARDMIRTKEFNVIKSDIGKKEHALHRSGHTTQIETDHIGIREKVEELDDPRMRVIDLIYFQGYTQSEAAEELQIPLGTVKSRTRSALEQLRISIG